MVSQVSQVSQMVSLETHETTAPRHRPRQIVERAHSTLLRLSIRVAERARTGRGSPVYHRHRREDRRMDDPRNGEPPSADSDITRIEIKGPGGELAWFIDTREASRRIGQVITHTRKQATTYLTRIAEEETAAQHGGPPVTYLPSAWELAAIKIGHGAHSLYLIREDWLIYHRHQRPGAGIGPLVPGRHVGGRPAGSPDKAPRKRRSPAPSDPPDLP